MFRRVWLTSYSYYKSKSGNISQGFQYQDAIVQRHGFYKKQGLRFISNNIGLWRRLDTDITNRKIEREKDSPPTAGSGPPKFNFVLWAKCLFCSVLSFFVPSIWKEKWAKLKTIEGEAEMVIEEVENVAEVVEKVATVAEKVAAQVAESLPDNSNLKKVALVVEHVSEVTAQDAHAATQFIHQVEEIKDEVDDGLESLIEPILQKIVKQEPKGK